MCALGRCNVPINQMSRRKMASMFCMHESFKSPNDEMLAKPNEFDELIYLLMCKLGRCNVSKY